MTGPLSGVITTVKLFLVTCGCHPAASAMVSPGFALVVKDCKPVQPARISDAKQNVPSHAWFFRHIMVSSLLFCVLMDWFYSSPKAMRFNRCKSAESITLSGAPAGETSALTCCSGVAVASPNFLCFCFVLLVLSTWLFLLCLLLG